MPSFDIVSEVNLQEVENAVNQATKEIQSRYDFKGSKAKLEWDKKEIQISAEDDYKIGAMKDILQTKMHRRGVDIQALQFTDPEQVGGMMLKMKVTLVQGIDKEMAKKITKSIKDSKLKVQPQIVDDKVRVTSKSIDALQECIQFIKQQALGIPVQFENMRS
ncbi:MAG: YajQ family cyclic di-GMP-binding protein [Bdellovibrionaceae bacterium]|nr:YajQ family cyclic di-GMP-binding protein [Bdellovibrionales bacterium]MCB9083305.1 YajQ family cyclic di-GMP-binding protein [Pseudobdellovibrionaceae bacterium]